MRVLVTGAQGQLGRDLLTAYEGHTVVGLGRADLDVTVDAAVRAAFDEVRPDLVVHAAAWTDVDGCEQDPDRAHEVNAEGTRRLARACRPRRVPMLMVSTDYVFGGRPASRPYTEDDDVAPVNVYGRSKLAGERYLQEALEPHYVVRTSWLCGAGGRNFVKTMLDVGRDLGQARVVDDQVGSPTFTRDLARAIREISLSGRFGVYHRTNTGACSWYAFAAEVFAQAGLDVDLRPIDSGELPRPAERPGYSVLANARAERDGLAPLPTWQEGLRQLLAELGRSQGDRSSAPTAATKGPR